jgi:hypothetical protein
MQNARPADFTQQPMQRAYQHHRGCYDPVVAGTSCWNEYEMSLARSLYAYLAGAITD